MHVLIGYSGFKGPFKRKKKKKKTSLVYERLFCGLLCTHQIYVF